MARERQMNRCDCPYEQDILDALTSRRWPDRCEPQLRDHVVSCVLCADLVRVAGALLHAADGAEQPLELPAAGVVWWRSQLRAREEAARAAVRPIRVAQYIAAAFGTGLLLLLISVGAPHAWNSLAAAVAQVPAFDVNAVAERLLSALPGIDREAASQAALSALANRGVQLAAGAWMILAPVAIYLAFARD